ncbi:MAG: hypothetical protein M0Q91_13860 [Methanoregula sp.]|jgi:hypothetical protein|nr:hypothetical protein [Methanoregula sp.]
MVTIKQTDQYSINLTEGTTAHPLAYIILGAIFVICFGGIFYMAFSKEMYPLSWGMGLGIIAVVSLVMSPLWRVQAYIISSRFNTTPSTGTFQSVTIRKGKPAVDQILICNAARDLEVEILKKINENKEEERRLKEIAGKCK